MAYRINPSGGIVQIKLNPESIYSSFGRSDFVEFLLKVRSVRIIKLDDGSKLIVRPDSFLKKTKEEFNEKATKLLHDKSWQKTAVIRGPAIVVLPEDWKT